mmetsp:Transcript_71290/g.82941  ORF Transcript_71290/g.82941 Transcript_71290/m.82941 type:complete len:145 (-) Transcript_71290:149-583(-)
MLKTCQSLAKVLAPTLRSGRLSVTANSSAKFYLRTPAEVKFNPVYSFSTQENSQLLEEVQEKIFQVLRSAAKTKQDKLTKTATFEELGYDSLDAVEMIVALEENLGVDITDEESEKIRSVQDAITIFHKHALEKYSKGTETEGK